MLSTVLGVTGLYVAYAYYAKNLGPHGLTSRNRFARGGYTFLENKYYLDRLYTDVIAGGVKGPIARGADWVNQNVIDGVVERRRRGRPQGRRRSSTATSTRASSTASSTAPGSVSDESGQLLRRLQTGKVQQYGAILFAGATVLAGVFVFVVR